MVAPDDALARPSVQQEASGEEGPGGRRTVFFIFCLLISILFTIIVIPGPLSFTPTAHANQSKQMKNTQQGFLRLDREGAQQTQASTTGVFTLQATKIVGTNAHMTFTDLSHPILTFTVSTITGFQLSVTSQGIVMALSAGGSVTTTATAIKTALADFLATSKSFANPTDLFALVAGKTVSKLVLNNVSLVVDTYIQADSIDLLQVGVSTS